MCSAGSVNFTFQTLQAADDYKINNNTDVVKGLRVLLRLRGGGMTGFIKIHIVTPSTCPPHNIVKMLITFFVRIGQNKLEYMRLLIDCEFFLNRL